MADILQTFSNAFSWMKSVGIWTICYWCLFLMFQLKIKQHFKSGPNQCLLMYCRRLLMCWYHNDTCAPVLKPWLASISKLIHEFSGVFQRAGWSRLRDAWSVSELRAKQWLRHSWNHSIKPFSFAILVIRYTIFLHIVQPPSTNRPGKLKTL